MLSYPRDDLLNLRMHRQFALPAVLVLSISSTVAQQYGILAVSLYDGRVSGPRTFSKEEAVH